MNVEQQLNAAIQWAEANPIVVVLIVAVAIIGYVLYKQYDKVEQGDDIIEFERTDLDERIQEDLEDRVEVLGHDNDKPLFWGEMNEIGTVTAHIKDPQPDDRSISILGENDSDDEDIDFSEVSIMEFTPSEDRGLKKKVLDDIFGLKSYSRFVIVDDEHVDAEASRVVIDGNVKLERRGGSFCQDGFAAENVINDIVTSDTYEAFLEATPDFVDKANEFDSQHSQKRAMWEKMNEMDMKDLLQDAANH